MFFGTPCINKDIYDVIFLMNEEFLHKNHVIIINIEKTTQFHPNYAKLMMFNHYYSTNIFALNRANQLITNHKYSNKVNEISDQGYHVSIGIVFSLFCQLFNMNLPFFLIAQSRQNLSCFGCLATNP